MKVLITGGAGYVGGALTDTLKGHEVRVYDSLVFEESYMKDVDFVLGDIRDRQKLKKHLDWADCVVWLAAIVGDGACALDPTLTRVVNEDSVRWLSEVFNGRIIFMSTCSVYGARDGALDERSPTNPLSLYAATKLKAEGYLRNKNAIIFRLGTLFGLGDKYSRIRLDLVANTLTAKAIGEGKLTVFGGDQYRPLLHVKDAAQAIAQNIETQHTGVFNLHWDNMTIIELAKTIQPMISCTIDVVGTTFEDSRNYRASSDKACKTFQFHPIFSVERGIEEVKTLLEQGRIKDMNNKRYSNVGFLKEQHGVN